MQSDDVQSMAALLEEESPRYPELRRGGIIEGIVVGTDRDSILVDIGAKSEGVVPPHEMQCLRPQGPSSLSPGDKVLVFVIQPESPEGQIILSLDRARGERGWRVLQDYFDQSASFEGYVTGSNRGGLLVNVEGVNAFVPLSQIASGRPERGSPEATEKALNDLVGNTMLLKVIELNRRRNRAILSERAAQQERRAAEKERLLQELHEGDIRHGRITSIRDFGIFVDIGGADGLVHLSELSWERTPKSPQEMFRVGDDVEVYVLKVDQENKKIALSLRRAQPEQWEEIVSRYREGQIVPGQVTKLAPFGAFVRLDGPIEGLIHISELVDRRVNHPKEVVDEGDVVPVKIVRIEHDRHRLGLSLRQARDKAEEDGWSFRDSGGVLRAPDEVLEQLGVEATSIASVEEAAPAEAIEEPAAVAEEVAAEDVSETAEAEEAAVAVEEVEEPAAEAVEEPAEVAEEPAVEELAAEAIEEPVEVAEEVAAEDVSETSEVEEAPVAVEEAEEPAAEAIEEPAAEAEEPAEVEAALDEPDESEEAPEEEAEVAAEEAAETVEAIEEPVEEAVEEEPAAEGSAEGVEAEVGAEEEAGVTEDAPKALNKVDSVSAEKEEGQVEAESEEKPSG